MTMWPELTPDKLRFSCEDCQFDFETTAAVSPLSVMIGQERAVKAVEFGLFAKNPGYNIFMSGLVGTGKITYAQAAVRKVAADQEKPGDWCYVNNLENPGQPIALGFPAGIGCEFRQDMLGLVEDLKTDIPKVFNSENYEQAKSALAKEFQEQRTATVENFNKHAEALGIMPQWSSTGFVGVPVVDGKPVTPEDYQQLEKEKRDEIEKKMLAIHEKAMEVIHRMQQMEREVREELKNLDEKVGLFAVGHLIDELEEKYREYDGAAAYLESVKQDVVKNISDFKPQTEEEPNPMMFFRKHAGDAKDKYKVNLLVDNRETEGAPVVVEINPTYYNLTGRMEYETRMGVANTDYTMLKAGALHRANGGYLILNARDVVTNLGAWEALKRVLKTKTLQPENLSEQYGILAMASLKPQPIPVNVKVILIGSHYLYQLLYNYDEDFRKLFKVHADFDVQMDNNAANIQKLAAFVSSTVRHEQLKEFDRSAVAKVAEYSSRLTGSQKKLTTQFNEIVEILCEADVWATIEQQSIITGAHIRRAIDERRIRSNKYEERMQEMFAEGKLLIDADGEKVGQVNGLAVLSVGEYMFGKPSRITANTYLGRGGVINIERETRVSGASHSKGVLILSGYLGEKYAQKHPLTLTASLTFEQLYDGVDGDSASSTELYALLSSLAGIPIRQYIAVTGSVNQKGEIQPIGGATQKIEGFFDVCRLKGLTGRQGVMIPHQNVSDLTLNDDVVEAVREGKFHIYPVESVDQGIEILTGVDAGQLQDDGTYPADTINGMVSRKLREYTEALMKLGKSSEDGNNDKAGQE
ncbi:MAG TPA: ATP-binding protein [Patescibacteria group bacterium]|nr:ATP-binding protein [Patescibacteria group bacterium]